MFGDLTTGAESDIQQLTRIARHMVGRWGMSRAIGPIAVIPADGQSPLLPGVGETSEQTQRLVDEEVRRIVETAHEEATELLSPHRANLDSLVAALLEHETLDEAEAYAAAGPGAQSRGPARGGAAGRCSDRRARGNGPSRRAVSVSRRGGSSAPAPRGTRPRAS